MVLNNSTKPIIVIEHCEKELSPWLILEYRHSSMIYNREYLLFTNVPEKYHKILSKYGRVRKESIVDLVRIQEISPENLIILDPKAERTLTHQDLVEAKYVVVGGILGDHPPRGRTWKLITSKMPRGVKAFNIGDGQYSIDGTVFYISYLLKYGNTSDYKYVDGITIKTDHGEIHLPFRYPIVNNKPLIADGLEYYLTHRKIRDDIWLELINQ
ncbi:MAG: RNA methyltransferase [Desulfurococcaceae archaeon]